MNDQTREHCQKNVRKILDTTIERPRMEEVRFLRP